ncbi:MAG TPA: AraC family transcriptional regulator [Kineosporiaceae bacterium]
MTYVPFAAAVIAPHMLRYLHLVAKERGHDLAPALREVGLLPQALTSTGIRVSYRQGAAVIARVLRTLDDPLLGLVVGSRQHAASWGLLGLALMTADTLGAGIAVGLSHEQDAGALVEWHTQATAAGGLRLVATTRDPVPDPLIERFLVDEAFSSVLAVARDALGGDLTPERVHLRYPAPDSSAARAVYRDCLGVPPTFGTATNQIVFTAEHLRRVPPRRDPWVHASAVAAVEATAPTERRHHDLIHSLEVAIAQALPRVPTLIEHACDLQLSERTLRRRLAAAGTSYGAIVDGVRRTAVHQLLTGTNSTLHEIAGTVGFSDARTLRRAVVRWTGSPPSAVRSQAIAASFGHQ